MGTALEIEEIETEDYAWNTKKFQAAWTAKPWALT